jgi:hypothetical protein
VANPDRDNARWIYHWLSNAVQAKAGGECLNSNAEAVVQSFLSHCYNSLAGGKASPGLSKALSDRRKGKYEHRKEHRAFLEEVGITLEWMVNVNVFLWENPSRVKAITLPKLRKPFPSPRTWICETPEIYSLWNKFIKSGGLVSDKRLKQGIPRLVREEDMTLVIDENTSCIVRDKDTNEIVLLVLRDFCANMDLLDWVDEVIREVVSTRRNVRVSASRNTSFLIFNKATFQKDDPGHMSIVGWSCGSRSEPCFGWARNLLGTHTPEEVSDFNEHQCGVFAFFWNLLRYRLPREVLNDYDKFFTTTLVPAMNASKHPQLDRTGDYVIRAGNHEFKFSDAELAPPSGLMVQNYTRCAARLVYFYLANLIRYIHAEKQPHKYAAGWNITREAGRHEGGHFYIASYGIKIISMRNHLVVWQQHHHHGTSLTSAGPKNANAKFAQRGICLVSSSRLAGVWDKYVASLDGTRRAAIAAAREAAAELWARYETDEIEESEADV